MDVLAGRMGSGQSSTRARRLAASNDDEQAPVRLGSAMCRRFTQMYKWGQIPEFVDLIGPYPGGENIGLPGERLGHRSKPERAAECSGDWRAFTRAAPVFPRTARGGRSGRWGVSSRKRGQKRRGRALKKSGPVPGGLTDRPADTGADGQGDRRAHMHVEPVLGNIDADKTPFHNPSPRMWSRSADQATVRVHGNSGRGAMLIRGLQNWRGRGLPPASTTGTIAPMAIRRDTRGGFWVAIDNAHSSLILSGPRRGRIKGPVLSLPQGRRRPCRPIVSPGDANANSSRNAVFRAFGTISCKFFTRWIRQRC